MLERTSICRVAEIFPLLLLLLLSFQLSQCQTTVDKLNLTAAENLNVDTKVGAVPSRAGYTYAVSTQTPYFKTDPITGDIRTKSVIDREALDNPEVKFIVTASHPSSDQYLVEVTVTILDENDNSPHFPNPSANYTIPENSVLQQPFTLTATDPDNGINGSTSLMYSIQSGNGEGYFQLSASSSSSGEKRASLSLVRSVDREEVDRFELVIRVRDGGTPPLFSDIRVYIHVQDLNDNHPSFDMSVYSGSVFENEGPGHLVLPVIADDQDLGNNAALVYEITRNSLFEIDRNTGEVKTLTSLSSDGILREKDLCQESYCNKTSTSLCLSICVFEVTVRDQEGVGGNSRSDQSRLRIEIQDVNDHDPVIIYGAGITPHVGEDATPDSFVFLLTITDSDMGQNSKVTVRISHGNELGHFKMNCFQPSLAVQYCSVTVNSSLDKETIPMYNLTFTATDEGIPPRSGYKSIEVVVTDSNDHGPVFEQPNYSATVSELDPVNSYVTALTATDADEGENGRIEYQITGGNTAQFFKINRDTGLITVNRPVDSDGLEVSRLKLNVTASDHGTNPFRGHASLTVDIIDENDEIPIFSQPDYNVNIPENAARNFSLITLSATDRDKGANGSVQYKISMETAAKYPNIFQIDHVGGQLSVRPSLDRELVDQYEVKIVAYDLGAIVSLSSTAAVHVTVQDQNDNHPRFYPSRYIVTVPVNARIGYPVTTVFATDLDAGDNGRVTYRIIAGASNSFNIDQQTGAITVSKQLLVGSSFDIQVRAVDKGNLSSRSEARVIVTVANPNEPDPEFPALPYTFTKPEDASQDSPLVGRVIGQVHANASTVLKYSIVDGDPAGMFNINENTGMITSRQALDREDVDNYELTVVAKGVSKVASANVKIIITDKNDNDPIFDLDMYELSVDEDASVGQVVFVAQAVDSDTGDNSRMAYTLTNDPQTQFVIDGDSGAVTLRRLVSFGQIFTFTVTATDRGDNPRSSSAQVKLAVADVNDHTPLFEHPEYSVAVSEHSLVNHRFLRLTATDADQGLNAEVTYSLVAGVNQSRPEFGVFPDGNLYVAQPLDRERKDRYQIVVQASDSGIPYPRKSTAVVKVKVDDYNDNEPEFSSPTYNFKVLEGSTGGTYIGSVSARDTDSGRNADIMYFFDGNQRNFELDPFTGEIRSRHEFDRESLQKSTGQLYYSFPVKAYDNGQPRLLTQAEVKVTVEDVNDNAPVFSQSVYRETLSENTAIGQMIYPITASDADEDLIIYSITSGNDGDKFRLNQNTGALSLIDSLDREIQDEYNLVITATDDGSSPPLSSNTSLIISVSDFNDQPPRFTKTSYTATVKENSPAGTFITQVMATDKDIGVNAVVEFSITQGNLNGMFSIDKNSGIVSVTGNLDYEIMQSHTLTVTASNIRPITLSSTARLIINILDVNDIVPVFASNVGSSILVPENAAQNVPVVTVNANDAEVGRNGIIKYSIIRQTPGNDFFVDESTGALSPRNELDRETVTSYKITVQAEDQAEDVLSRLRAQKTLSIFITDVNDNAPMFISPAAAWVSENSANGTEIMTVRAKDLDKDGDKNSQIDFSLLSGTGNFQIDQMSGLLTLSHGISTSPVLYSITVRASDRGQPQKSTEQSIKIIVTSAASSGLKFSRNSYSVSLSETDDITEIVKVSATGAGNVAFYVTKVVASWGGIQPALFKMVNNGDQMVTTGPLDRDQGYQGNAVYTVEVYAQDKGSSSPRTARAEVVVTLLDVNDSPPVFTSSQYMVDVSESESVDFLVQTVTANDPDINPTVTYQLSGQGAEKFTINRNNGEVRLAFQLDRETVAEYDLTVTASDGPTHTSSVRLLVTVTDTNDESPTFSETAYSFIVLESAAMNTEIGSVSATDYDLGQGGKVTYRLLTTWQHELFHLDAESGLLTLNGALDFENIELYVLEVQATDKGTPRQSSNVTVYVNVLDLNDNEPVFSPASYSVQVAENVGVGSPIAQVYAFDEDAGLNGQVEYSIQSVDPVAHLSIWSGNGTIYTVHGLDRETVPQYTVIVQATDSTEPISQRKSSTGTVTVTVTDVNDQAPKFVTPSTVYVNEAAAINDEVLTFVAVDGDEGRNGQVEYSLTSMGNVFSMTPTTGKLKVRSLLDRESQSTYEISVIARDLGDPSLTTMAQFTVMVEDANDNDPVFSPNQQTQLTVREDQQLGETLLNISATDKDTGLRSEIRYYIIGGDKSRDFYLDQYAGKLSVSRTLDYESKKSYTLKIQAQDSGEQPRSATIDIHVTVSDWNDCAAVFPHSPYQVYMQEEARNTPVKLVQVTAVDADSAKYNQTNYDLYFDLTDEGQDAKKIFAIDDTTGEITAKVSVDREQKANYQLHVIAENRVEGMATLTGTAVVNVIVNDINDHSPTFDLPLYSARIGEGQNAVEQVLQVTATDLDVGENGEVRYALLNNTAAEKFHIDPLTGWLSTSETLDREEVDFYSLSVIAFDHGSVPQSSTTGVKVYVTDLNDNNPAFIRDDHSVLSREFTAGGKFVTGVTAVDPDLGENGTLSYSLRGTGQGFTIDQHTGVIKTTQQVASGRSLTVRATDGGARYAESTVTLSITDTPASAFPTFQATNSDFQVSENASVGSMLTQVVATAGDSHIYAIAGGNVGDVWSVKSDGRVILRKSLDVSVASQFELYIEARITSNNLSSYKKLSITVTDVNLHTPTFEQALYLAEYLEEQNIFSTTVLATVKAVDRDTGPFGMITYTIESGNIENPFLLDRQTGKIELIKKLDREIIARYDLVIRATDSGGLYSTCVVIVNVLDINDNFPNFGRQFKWSVPEDVPVGTIVSAVSATDRDTGVNADIKYKLAEANDYFEVSITGNVSVKAELNRESTEVHRVVITAENQGKSNLLTVDTTVQITVTDVNDNAPSFLPSKEYYFEFQELQPRGAAVGQIQTSDADSAGPNSDVIYRLVNPSSFFLIENHSGGLKSKEILHYDPTGTHNTYTLFIEAQDRGTPSFVSIASVNVSILDANDHAPVFDQPSGYFSAVPNVMGIGQVILSVTATDENDFGDNAELEYTINGGSGSAVFGVGRLNGSVYTTGQLGSRTGQNLTIQVQATDKGVPPMSSVTTVTMTVTEENEKHPSWIGSTPFKFNVSESSGPGSLVGIVRATDGDSGINAELLYSINNGQYNHLFNIDTRTGRITLTKQLDYEQDTTYHMTLQVSDRAFFSKESFAVLEVDVIDADDSPPVFSQPIYYASVKEESDPVQDVITVLATDADQGSNADIRYSLISEADSPNHFIIDTNTGAISSRTSFDREARDGFKLLVLASNPSTNTGLNATATVLVDITGVNEFNPRFVQSEYTFAVNESERPNFLVGRLHATDDDDGIDGQLEYLLVAESNNLGFAINKSTGQLIVADTLDKESVVSIILTALVKNPGPVTGSNIDTAKITIHLNDANDSPTFSRPSYNGTVRENMNAGTLLSMNQPIRATDIDQQPGNREFYYQLEDETGRFRVDPDTGVISTMVKLDREETSSYTISVQAVDRGARPLTGQALVYILVSDANDMAPYFVPDIPGGSVAENMPVDSEVNLVLDQFTFDSDQPGNQGPYSYSMQSDKFKIDRFTGAVRTKTGLDYEQKSEYLLNIVVKDSGNPQQSATLQAKVNVIDMNDRPSSPRSATITVRSFNHFAGGVIGTVEPVDEDTVGNYSCSLSGTASSVFSIERGSCKLRASSAASAPRYTLSVSGHDGTHNYVQSAMQVEFSSYDNQTLDRTIVVRVSGLNPVDFASRGYPTLMQVLKNEVLPSQTPQLISIFTANNYIDIYLALMNSDGSYSTSLGRTIRNKKSEIETQTGLQILEASRDVCEPGACSGNGQCRSLPVVSGDLEFISSDSLVLTYHTVHLIMKCDCEQEFIGDRCDEPAGACASSPCMHNGRCSPQEEDKFKCTCPPEWGGSLCSENINECRPRSELNKCNEGSKCIDKVNGYTCECNGDFRGRYCDEPIMCMDRNPNPCLNNGTCKDNTELGYGYQCDCPYGFYGSHCNFSSMGFSDESYLELPPLETAANNISVVFATERNNALLIFQPGEGKNFLSLQIIDSSVTFTYFTDSLISLTVTKKVSTGTWYKALIVRNDMEASLKILYCSAPDNCQAEACSQTSSDCFTERLTTGSSQLQTGGRRVSIGGLDDINPILQHAEYIRSATYEGCIAELVLDGSVYGVKDGAKASGVMNGCPARRGQSQAMKAAACLKCAGDDCVHEWFNTVCQCSGYQADSKCDQVAIDTPITLTGDTQIIYSVKPQYRQAELLEAARSGGRRRRDVNHHMKRQADVPGNRLFVRVRTGQSTGLLMQSQPYKAETTLQLVDGYAQYGDLTNKLVRVSNSNWHNVTLIVGDSKTYLVVDGKSVNFTTKPNTDFFDLQTVTGMTVGGNKFQGCLEDFSLNYDKLPMSESQTDEFYIGVTGGSIVQSCPACPPNINICGGDLHCDDSGPKVQCLTEKPDGMEQWLLIVIIVVAVVATFALILAVVIIIMQLRKRRARKNGAEPRKNGTLPIMKAEVSEISGHDNLPDSVIMSTERPRSRQHNMSPSILSPMASRTVPSPYQQLEDNTVIIEGSITGKSDKNMDQYYDFDESVSIAPSDVDVRKYYKGYRKGDNMEMQMIPSHMRSSGKRSSPKPRDSPHNLQSPAYATSPLPRQSPMPMQHGRETPIKHSETPISQLQQRGLRQTPIDELNRRIAIEQRQQRRGSESSLTDGSVIRQPHWSHPRQGGQPQSRPTSRLSNRQTPQIMNPVSAQRQQDLNRLSNRSLSSSMDSDEEAARRHQPMMERNIYSEAGDSSSDESSNDSFTASEFEPDEPKVRNDLQPTNMMFTKLQEVEDESDTGDPNAYRTTFSWDGLRNVDNSLQRFINNSDSNTNTDADSITKPHKQNEGTFRWDYFLNWGPSFERLVGVFTDIAELPTDGAEDDLKQHQEYI